MTYAIIKSSQLFATENTDDYDCSYIVYVNAEKSTRKISRNVWSIKLYNTDSLYCVTFSTTTIAVLIQS